MHICKFCNNERKNANSLRNHERLCKENPNRQNSADWNNKNGNLGKSNQYIKAKALGLAAPIVSEENKQKARERNLARPPEFYIKNGAKISNTIRQKVKDGTWHTSLAKKMHHQYKGASLHGTWEVAYAKYLDANKIIWERNTKSFPYVYKDVNRRYTPDFYLPDTNEYVEIKGYKTEKDEAKWTQFPQNEVLRVLMHKDLKSLGIIK